MQQRLNQWLIGHVFRSVFLLLACCAAVLSSYAQLFCMQGLLCRTSRKPDDLVSVPEEQAWTFVTGERGNSPGSGE